MNGVAAVGDVAEVKKWGIAAGTEYNILLYDLRLHIRNPVPSAKLYSHHDTLLATKSAKYYFYSPDLVVCDIRQGTISYQSHPLWSGSHLPIKILAVWYVFAVQ